MSKIEALFFISLIVNSYLQVSR